MRDPQEGARLIVVAFVLAVAGGASALTSATGSGAGTVGTATTTTTTSAGCLPSCGGVTEKNTGGTGDGGDVAGGEGRPAAATPGAPARGPAATPEPGARKAAAATPQGRLPVGKGMWLYQLSQAGDPDRIVRQAGDAGLTHLYLRVGSSKMGFYGAPELDALLPAAHAAGLAVVGWDFVYLFDPAADARRSFEAITYTTPDGHRMDAFSADIETAAEGVNLTADGAAAYGRELRALVGPDYPLIATVPRPSPKRWFPFAEATDSFDAIAPMVYWMNRDPAADARGAIADLAGLGKPVMPIGQAYDGAPEGGPAGDPSGADIRNFMAASMESGAVAVSFWVWHHSTPEQWAAIEDARAWELRHSRDRAQERFLQALLNLHGHALAPDGDFGPRSRAALAATQQSLGLPSTGTLDRATADALLGRRAGNS